MDQRRRLSFSRWLVACALAGVPLVAWLARGAHARKAKDRANQNAFAPDPVADFTAEQTAFLARVREICDTNVAGQVSQA
jgi:hypothetical protein